MVILPYRRKAFRSSGGTAPPAPSTDPYFANVVLLLHFDGSNGATTTTDSSSYNKAITFYGNAQITTADFKFGSASLLLDGNGDYIDTPSSTDFAFPGNFTMEAWVYLTSNGGVYKTIFSSGGGTNSYGLYHQQDTSLTWYSPNGTGLTTLGAISLNAWHHIAVCRAGSSIKFFVDGIQLGATLTDSTSFACPSSFKMGYDTVGYAYLAGKMDDVRITKGIARYTANFTPPTEAFPNSAPPPIEYSFVNTSYKSFNTGSAALPTGTQVNDLWLFLHADYYDSDATTSGFIALSPVQGVATAYYGDWYKVPSSLGADVPLPFYAQGTLIALRKASGTPSIINSNFTFNASSTSLTCTGMVGTGTLILRATYQASSDKGLSTPAGFTLLHSATPLWLGGNYQFFSVFKKTNDGAGVTVTLTSAAAFQISMTLVN